MAFNKNRALENALKLLNQGKFAQAITEYQQILRHDPEDQATLMTVGDLLARQGDTSQATEYFERLARVYQSEGFNSKAIAIYKKIAKLAPNELAPLERLAELYVQQGVLSEARPLFLQIAEAHWKANRGQKAVESLQRLLDAEPDNPRVQVRLAELYSATGKKPDAAHTYLAYAQRLQERGETSEAQKQIDRALEIVPDHPPALLLRAKLLSANNQKEQAIAILTKHPEVDAGGDVTHLLVELQLASGHLEDAADRARHQLAHGKENLGLLQKVVDLMINGGHAAEALPLLRELRDPMIDAGEQEKFLKILLSATETLPGNAESLEMLADFSRRTSDPFHLNDALSQLTDLYAAAGDYPRAEEMLQELIERNREDERLAARLEQLRARAQGGTPVPGDTSADQPSTVLGPPEFAPTHEEAATTMESPSPEAETASAEEPVREDESLDEETQKYITQALTDVDLFSSYGLTNKATALLESILERAPRHTPTLTRLLDCYLGAGNDRRVAELAARLEQVHRERGNAADADRFTEIRQRYQKLAGLTDEELASAQAATSPAASEAPSTPATTEFDVPLNAPADTEERTEAFPADPIHAQEAPNEEPATPVPPPMPPALTEEVDLTDEWEAMALEVSELSNTEMSTESLLPDAEAHEQATSHDNGAGADAAASESGEFELRLSPTPVRVPEEASTAPRADANGSRENGDVPGELKEVFQEFRRDLGEMGGEHEDLETHYNLGIAYREMGLFEEAIGEFQKVATSVQKGAPFRYAMNCATLLALTFMDKGEPKIAAMWYQRALDTPGLDQETTLALRYDLGVSLETAGDASSALESFRQVYAMNIDYRDVADRIATLQKH